MIEQFEKVLVSKEALKYPLTKKILAITPESKISYEDKPKVGKNTIFLTIKKGSMIKRIPYEDETCACLIYQTNCRLGCSYCYLQSYYHSPVTIYVNSPDLLRQIDLAKKRFKKFYAGELNDSLDLDGLTHYTKVLIPFFNTRPDLFLELRSKTDNITNLLELKPTSNIVLSWSLNPEKIIKEYEKKTASLSRRLNAANNCQKAGYKIGFHLDPLIYITDFEERYSQLIELIAKMLSQPEKIAYISLGGVRFTKELVKIIRQKPLSERKILSAEFVPGKDGKLRYFKPMRMRMYRFILDKIRVTLGDIHTYFCME